MFTGIIEEVGTIGQIRRGPHSAVLTIHAETVLEDTRIGDSIAVNGICLTVTKLSPGSFSADIMHETLNRSSLAKLTHGSRVNLERAMMANGRLGGTLSRDMWTVSGKFPIYGGMIPRSGIRYKRSRRFCGILWKKALLR